MKVIEVRNPGGLDNLTLADRDKPEAGPGELLVRVRASSLNYHDYIVAVGGIPTPDDRVPMSDGAGDVEAVGEGVEGWAVGDKALSLFFPSWHAGGPQMTGFQSVPGDGADGFAAEYVAMPASAFTRMPTNLNYAEAATLTCAGLTAWRAIVEQARVKAGDWVLVQGTGGVSIFALQFAKALGARVIATSSSDEKLKRVTGLGADAVINYKDTPEWGQKALEMTGGVDAVVEIGGAGTLPQSIKAAKIGGHISMIGVLAGFSGEIPTAEFFAKNLRMDGITVGSAKMQEDMIRAVEANDIKPVLDKDFPLAQLADAFRHQESQKHFGKITVSI
ncbi:MAG: NAD(P)-dependent alcohol dehydrogenase [Pacificimonas sp.]|jgi:NADPH:quinone reductase-like Zn-dependent oxidoreductase|nr:NAD(P)-dependent alcohol dehydrogenase [Pacificimonas sp.]